MAKSINEIHILGRAGKDANVRRVGDKEVVEVTVATGGGQKKDKSGDWPTEWHTVKVWSDKPAYEQLSMVTKGQEVEVWGYVKTESWDDKKSGEKKYKTVIMANSAGEAPQPSQPKPQAKAATVDTDCPF